MGQADTFRYREDFQGRYGAVPTEAAPRLNIIHAFAVGRPGIPETYLDMPEMFKEFSDGVRDAGLSYARVYGGQSYAGSNAGRIECSRVTAFDAVVAESLAVASTSGEGDDIVAVPQVYARAVGPGEGYNDLIVRCTVTRIEPEHPNGPFTRVFTVLVQCPDPKMPWETFENIVFSDPGGIKGTSAFDQTYDASTINDALEGSKVIQLLYSPTADSTFGGMMELGESVELVLSGGSDGEITLEDWQRVIDEATALDFRWFVIPQPPTEEVRGYFVAALKKANFNINVINQMYGESLDTFIEARKTYGNTVANGEDMYFWGYGEHLLEPGSELSFSAAYMGRWSAKIASTGLGAEYPVGNEPLGYRSISKGDKLTRASQELVSGLGINFAKQLTGGFGVHGYWTGDALVDRMGDASKRAFWNDCLRRWGIAFVDLAQNRGNTVITRNKIKVIGDAAIQPYITAGYAISAATGTYSYEEVVNRFVGLGWPSFDFDWAYYLAQIRFAPTLGGVFVHATDQEIKGLVSLIQGAGSNG